MTPIPVRSRTLLALAAILCLGLNNPVWSQDKKPGHHPPPGDSTKHEEAQDEDRDKDKDDEQPAPRPMSKEEQLKRAKLSEKIDDLLEGYDLTPHPLPAVPDDPPPHEGAMIHYPLVIEAPDLLLVEVLDALPGRPISGERLVRPDGKVTLGFYGEVDVAGLSLVQAKVQIVKHLRAFLDDDLLGLYNYIPKEDGQPKGNKENEEPKTRPRLDRAPTVHGDVPKGYSLSDEPIHPDATDRVFADITAYNHTEYYVLGDVATPGKLPFTGRETVMDAIQHAGGFLHTADQKNIRLVRPARGGKPAKIYPIDIEAIQDKGDITANYQLFPDDRLVVGRLEIAKKTEEVDRIANLKSTIIHEQLQEALLLRAMQFASPYNKNALLKDAFDFWLKQLDRKPEDPLDEKAFRELLERLTKERPGVVPAPR